MNSLIKGVIAGVAGTGVMTAYQMGEASARPAVSTDVPHRWAERCARAGGEEGRRRRRPGQPRHA